MPKSASAQIAVIGIDIGKNSFHIVGHDGLLFEAAKVLLSRSAKPSDLQAWGRAARQAHRFQESDHGGRAQACGDPPPHVDDGRALWIATPVPTTA